MFASDACVRQRYKGAGRELAPVPYSQFPEPLGASTVRLLVVPLAPQAPEIVNSIQELSQTFQATLPAGIAKRVLHCVKHLASCELQSM